MSVPKAKGPTVDQIYTWAKDHPSTKVGRAPTIRQAAAHFKCSQLLIDEVMENDPQPSDRGYLGLVVGFKTGGGGVAELRGGARMIEAEAPREGKRK